MRTRSGENTIPPHDTTEPPQDDLSCEEMNFDENWRVFNSIDVNKKRVIHLAYYINGWKNGSIHFIPGLLERNDENHAMSMVRGYDIQFIWEDLVKKNKYPTWQDVVSAIKKYDIFPTSRIKKLEVALEDPPKAWCLHCLEHWPLRNSGGIPRLPYPPRSLKDFIE